MTLKDIDAAIDSQLLQFIGEYHNGLNELAGNGTAVEQARAKLKQLIIEAQLEVWEYISKTPISYIDITDLDTDPTGETKYRDHHYCPPVRYVDDRIKSLRAALEKLGER